MDELRELIAAARHVWAVWHSADTTLNREDLRRLENAACHAQEWMIGRKDGG